MPSASRRPARSRGRAERSATRARMRSTSPTCRSSECRAWCRPVSSNASIACRRMLARPARRAAAAGSSGAARGRPCGGGVVEHAEQRAVRRAREARVEFEVAPGGGVELQRLVAFLAADAAQMRQGGLLRVAHVLQQAARRADRQRRLREPKPGEVARAELLAQQCARALPASKCHGGRSRTAPARSGACDAAVHSRPPATRPGRRRSSSAASASSPVASSAWKRPLESSSQARPKRSPDVASAASSVSRRSSSSASSVSAGRDDAHHLALDRALATSPGRRSARRSPPTRPCARRGPDRCRASAPARPPSGSARRRTGRGRSA